MKRPFFNPNVDPNAPDGESQPVEDADGVLEMTGLKRFLESGKPISREQRDMLRMLATE